MTWEWTLFMWVLGALCGYQLGAAFTYHRCARELRKIRDANSGGTGEEGA